MFPVRFHVCLLYVCCKFTARLLYFYCTFPARLLYVYCTFTVRLLYVYCTFKASLRYTVKNNSACQHVKLQNPHNFVASAIFRWSWRGESHIVCRFSHPSSESRRCDALSADFEVWRENVMDFFLPCTYKLFSYCTPYGHLF